MTVAAISREAARPGLIAISVSCASLFIWVAALPPFQFGIWYLSEPVDVALFASGALAAAVLAMRPSVDAFRHPLVWIPLLIAALSFAMSAFVPFPVRSWFGPPQTGEGAFWYLTLGLLVAMFRAIWLPMLFYSAAFVSAVALAALTMFGPAVSAVPDYLAFVGLCLMVAQTPATLVLAAALVILSGSKGAMLIVPACIGAALLGAPRRLFAAAVPLLVMVALAVASSLPSAWSRIMLWAAAARALVAEPGIWMHGVGWGGFNDLTLRHRDVILAMLPPGYGPNGADWHSHNEFIEALVSIGPLGAALMVALFVVAAHHAPDRLRAGGWAAYAGISAIWMPSPIVVPFLALALAITSRWRDATVPGDAA